MDLHLCPVSHLCPGLVWTSHLVVPAVLLLPPAGAPGPVLVLDQYRARTTGLVVFVFDRKAF